MIVRTATLQDYDEIKRLMVDFANNNPVEDLKNPKYDNMHVNRVLDFITKEGVALVCEENNVIVGMLLATIQGDLWLPQVKRMTEVAWWVENAYRGSTAGARLLKEYIRIGNLYKKQKLIQTFTLTTLATTPELKLSNRGWEPIDFNWVFRG